MLVILLILLPIWFVGFQLTSIISTEKRLEVILPISLFGSINLFILMLNTLSYIFHPPLGIYIVYVVFIILGLVLWRIKKLNLSGIDIPKGTSKKIFILSIVLWAILLFQIIGHTGLQGDPTLYAIIAKSFTRGNFPILPPWQPDIKLAYHYGPSIFMGVFHKLSGSSFDLIQRSTSFLIVLMLSTFLVWVFKRHLTLKSLVVYQLIPLMTLISLGNWMIAIPKFPLEFPQNFVGILNWVSKMPTVEMAFSTYGGSIVSLTGLIFFYHELIVVISFIWIVWLSFTYNKDKRIIAWTILTLSTASLSIINEVFIPLSLPAISLVIFCREFPFKTLITKKTILSTVILFFILTILVIFQGGVPTGLLTGKKSEYPTLQFFPDKKKTFVHNAIFDNHNNIVRLENTDWQTYQLQQQSSRLFLPTKEKWLPFIWFHPGVVYFYLANLITCILLFIFKQKSKLLICLCLILPALCASSLYNLTFSLSNYSGRLIGFTYSFLGVNLILSLIWILEYLKRNKWYVILISTLIIWLTIPSFLPNLAGFLIAGEKNNKLIFQDSTTLNPTEEWIYKNLPFNARLLRLSSINTSPLTNVGIFTPIWLGKYKDYSMDNSPEYFDLLYTINPTRIKEFKMSYILVDSRALAKLPEIRRDQLKSSEYFSLVYSTTNDLSSASWEGLYKINEKYINEVSDLKGTFKELDESIVPKKSKVYIDMSNEGIENKSKWISLRRALIFAMKDRNLFFKDALPGFNNQPYPHQEVKIAGGEPSKSIDYDYLILSYATDPKTICDCRKEIVWKGFDDFIFVWKIIKKS